MINKKVLEEIFTLDIFEIIFIYLSNHLKHNNAIKFTNHID